MNTQSTTNFLEATKAFKAAKISFEKLNNGIHWKIGSINFYPTTHKWFDETTGDRGRGLKEVVDFLKKQSAEASVIDRRKLSVDDIFNIAKKVYPHNLYDICTAIHKEIYG